jgi:hypothetical protein
MPARSIRRKLLASAAVVGLLAAATSAVVYSAFTSTAHSASSSFQAGSIALTADSTGSALFAMDGGKPGDAQSRCVTVRYAATGGLTSRVRLYGTTTGSAAHGGLDRYLALKVTRGSFPSGAPANGACDGFLADGSDAVLFDDLLSRYPATYETGLADPASAWHDGDSAVYRFDVVVQDDDAAQGRDATTEFAFQARNR